MGSARRQGTVPRARGSGSGSGNGGGRQAGEDWKKARGSILGAGDILILSLHCLLCAKFTEPYTYGACTFLNVQLCHEIMIFVISSCISEIEHETYLDMCLLHPHLPKQFDSNSSPACPISVCRSPQVKCLVLHLEDVCNANPHCHHHCKCPKLQIFGKSYDSLLFLCPYRCTLMLSIALIPDCMGVFLFCGFFWFVFVKRFFNQVILHLQL